jgi:replicative DNA helicase
VLLHPKDTSAKTRTINIIVAKNKEGWVGNFDMSFYPHQFRFEKIQTDPGI